MSTSIGSPREHGPAGRAIRASLAPLATLGFASLILSACSPGDAAYVAGQAVNKVDSTVQSSRQSLLEAARKMQDTVDGLQTGHVEETGTKPPAASEPDKRRARRRPPRPPGDSYSSPPPPSVEPDTATSPQEVTEPTPPVLPSPDNPDVPTPTNGVEDRIYSGADSDVVPPRLLRTRLPTPTFLAWAREVNVIELLVSATGVVEEARLVIRPTRLTDVQMLNVAKSLEFEPARRNGTPVRFRLTVNWESTP